MAKQIHPIGKRFQRLSATIDGSKRSHLRVYFVLADQRHIHMCLYLWQQGGYPISPTDKFQTLLVQAEGGDAYAVRAASLIKNEVIGQEGGSIKPRDTEIEIDKLANGNANLGISSKDKGFFTVHIFGGLPDISYFDLSFQGNAPDELVGKVQTGGIFRMGVETKFNNAKINTGRF
jgi:hypothetical protein